MSAAEVSLGHVWLFLCACQTEVKLRGATKATEIKLLGTMMRYGASHAFVLFAVSLGETMPRWEELDWFHAFDRSFEGAVNEIEVVTRVLVEGPGYHPDPGGRTRTNEGLLQIEPPHVYAYLGRTREAFGRFVLVIKQASLRGEVSPLDTGGLVAHIHPVCRYVEDAEKAAFLKLCSWPTTELANLLSVYPADDLERYMDFGEDGRPDFVGPQVPIDSCKVEEPIWANPENTWQAWTWEGRMPNRLQVDQLVAWSAPAPFRLRFREFLENASDEDWEKYKVLRDRLAPGRLEGLIESQLRRLGVAA